MTYYNWIFLKEQWKKEYEEYLDEKDKNVENIDNL
jgi:hypothetical protein